MPGTHLTVAAVIERQNRFLMVEELIDGAHVFNQPAGHVEPGETLQQAVVREMREETAWEFEPEAVTGIYLWTHPATAERFLRTVFTGHCLNHHPDEALDDGIVRAVWLSKDELLKQHERLRSPMVLRSINDYEAGARLQLPELQNIDHKELDARAQVVRP